MHCQHLYEIFTRFKKHNCKINFEKSNFRKKEVNYLGFIVNSLGIRPDTTRVNFIRNEKGPQTKRKLQRLIGFIN